MGAPVDPALIRAARRAGVKRWWGDGPRPLNMPGAAPNAQWTGPRNGAGSAAHDPGEVRGPVVLEPTPAQLAQGVRILEIAETSQATAMRMLRWARENGWTAQLTRSRYLTEPSNRVAIERRGRSLEVETVALRMHNEIIWAYARWDFDVELGKWGPGDTLTAWIAPGGRIIGLRKVGITALQVLMGMKINKERIEGVT